MSVDEEIILPVQVPAYALLLLKSFDGDYPIAIVPRTVNIPAFIWPPVKIVTVSISDADQL
jgi:hypothetical protein